MALSIGLARTVGAEDTPAADSGPDLGQQLNNPVASVWQLRLQSDHFLLEGDPSDAYRVQTVVKFQPVLPVPLTQSWNLVFRPTLPVVNTPYFETYGSNPGWGRTSGLSDISFFSLLTPAEAGTIIWGVGPTFVFDTASTKSLGSGKTQMGPAALALYLSKTWTVGTLAQHWWTVGGSSKRNDQIHSDVQYILWRTLPNRWQLGMSPDILYDHKAKGGNRWTVPIGFGTQSPVAKIGGMSVRLMAQVQYMVVHPDDFGQRWNFQFRITPVIPSLIKDPLF